MTPKQPHPGRDPNRLGKPALELLAALLRYRVLTGMQLTKLLYRPTSVTWVKDLLKQLYETGYVDRARLGTRPRQGTAPLCYALTSKGITILRSRGLTDEERGRPYRVHTITEGTLAHNLAVAELMIAAERLTKTDQAIELPRLLHDLDLKRLARPFIDADGRRRTVVPDAFLDVVIREEGGYRRPICVEVDRGSENEKRFRDKIRGLVDFSGAPYREQFNRRSLTIAIVAVLGEAKLHQLMRWTEAELRALAVDDAVIDTFRLATIPLDWSVSEHARPTPEAIFRQPLWYRPFTTEPRILLSKL